MLICTNVESLQPPWKQVLESTLPWWTLYQKIRVIIWPEIPGHVLHLNPLSSVLEKDLTILHFGSPVMCHGGRGALSPRTHWKAGLSRQVGTWRAHLHRGSGAAAAALEPHCACKLSGLPVAPVPGTTVELGCDSDFSLPLPRPRPAAEARSSNCSNCLLESPDQLKRR